MSEPRPGAARVDEGAPAVPRRRLPIPVPRLVRQLLSFLAVGGVGFVVDVTLFNVLRATVLDPERVDGGALWAKVLSTLAAIAVNWIGNRYVTFRTHHGRALAREAAEFLGASLLGSSISLGCLGLSHYVLGLTSAAADNVSANVIGLALGTALRFVLYRFWVFADRSGTGGGANGDEKKYTPRDLNPEPTD